VTIPERLLLQNQWHIWRSVRFADGDAREDFVCVWIHIVVRRAIGGFNPLTVNVHFVFS
jgi:hypothetical protein